MRQQYIHTQLKRNALIVLSCITLLAWGGGYLLRTPPIRHENADDTIRITGDPSDAAPTVHTAAPRQAATTQTASTPDRTLQSALSASIDTADAATGEPTILANGQHYPLRTYHALMTPNDPVAHQWWVSSTALDTAWGFGASAYTPTIAIIDSGFALQHEEFAGRWQVNATESGFTDTEIPSALNCSDQSRTLDMSCNNIDDDFDGIVDNESGVVTVENPSWLNCTDQGLPRDKSCNRIDDDNNGFVDDVTGWDFSSHDHSVQTGETNPAGAATLHATLVTGVAGATGNNAVGIAGTNWTARLLPLQALDDDGYGNTLTVARAIYYAADQGADIINISLGATAEDPYLRAAIHYALNQGSLVIAASGNSGCDCIVYPARYPEVVAVGAFSASNTPSAFSNYGAELDLLAPGEALTLPAWSTSNPTDAYLSGAAGTSFAAPYVSGILGLLKSHQPDASWGELTAALLETIDRHTLTATTPHSTTFGYGYIRADAPLARVTSSATPGLRYTFGPILATDTLDSLRTHQCEGRTPATKLYELRSGNTIRYTTSKLTLYQMQEIGWVKDREFHACVGLPDDAPSTVRLINLLSEIRNNATNKWIP